MTITPTRLERADSPKRPGGPGQARPVGRFRHDLATGRWWWSSETFALHGYEVDEITPTTDIFLALRHPDDRADVEEVLCRAGEDAMPFSSVHRIVTARGRERTLCLVGQGRRDRDTHEVVEVMGYFTDLTSTLAQRAETIAGEQIRAAAEHRATIEQAKGILALTCDVSASRAFSVLRAASNDHNVPLRRLSGWVVELAERLPAPEDHRRSVNEFLDRPREPQPAVDVLDRSA
ncbi:PAS and ANTAR domain-containing protein [Oerskovia sp. KBS0722]|uniref:PAS and ANTAR domain-containing protein n=1 Tax=Oerskovia sp. KBS0722 TaxID=1179673 RepID=UPI00143D7B3C|nr:PAS and ANTAR domain-containing protein [Oerskovia sp. KBS0722]